MPKLKELLENPPPARGSTEAQVDEMRNYLIRIVEELQYLLTHLESDNTNSTLWDDIDSQIPKPETSTPLMDGVGSAGSSPRWSRGNHRHPADSSKADVTALNAHKDDHTNPHQVGKAQVGLGNVDNVQQYSASNPPPIPTPAQVGAIPASDKGSAGGVAELDANGMVPSAQLPSYVDDVLEYASLSAFPATGEAGKIYVALDTNKTYRWSGSAYIEISESLALGETSSTAYRGDRGKAAYDHSQLTSGNPHNVTAADVGAQPEILVSGLLMGDGLGGVSAATAGTDYQTPLTAGTDYQTPLTAGTDYQTPLTAGTDYQTPLVAGTDYATPAMIPTVPDPSDASPQDLGTADAGISDDYSRADHVHNMPDADDIPYDNTTSGLMASDVQSAIDEIAQGGGGGGTAASAVSYDNTDSGLTATNVQDAIDEVYGDIPAAPATIQRRWYGECSSADDAAARVVSIPGIDALEDGLVITVLMIQAQNYNGSPTLNLNNLGAKSIYSRKSSLELIGYFEWPPGAVLDFCYNSNLTAWVIVNGSHVIGSYYGLSRPMSSLPLMDGTASRGSSNDFARGDHVHPRDESKADVAQLATVESGTTASRAYAVGEPFCWNGVLYRAKTAIASGDLFTIGTNCYSTVVTEGCYQPVPYEVISANISGVTGVVQKLGSIIMLSVMATTEVALTATSELLRIPYAVATNGVRISVVTGNTFCSGRVNAGTGALSTYSRVYCNGNIASGSTISIHGMYFI